jgi:hypothetical protein
MYRLKGAPTTKRLLEHLDVAPDFGLDTAAIILKHAHHLPRGSRFREFIEADIECTIVSLAAAVLFNAA